MTCISIRRSEAEYVPCGSSCERRKPGADQSLAVRSVRDASEANRLSPRVSCTFKRKGRVRKGIHLSPASQSARDVPSSAPCSSKCERRFGLDRNGTHLPCPVLPSTSSINQSIKSNQTSSHLPPSRPPRPSAFADQIQIPSARDP